MFKRKAEAPWVSVEIAGARGASGITIDSARIHGSPEHAFEALRVLLAKLDTERGVQIDRMEVRPGPFDPPADECSNDECGHPRTWHPADGRCTGDFHHCPCKGWMP